MKKTSKSIIGTRFDEHTFKSTPNQLTEILGKPSRIENNGEDKTNIEWHMELEEGDVFTIYDWKSNCVLDMDKRITWCIGAHELLIASKALAEIETRKQINEEIKKIIFPSK